MYVTLRESGFCYLLWYPPLQIPTSSAPISAAQQDCCSLMLLLRFVIWKLFPAEWMFVFLPSVVTVLSCLFSTVKNSSQVFSSFFSFFRAGGEVCLLCHGQKQNSELQFDNKSDWLPSLCWCPIECSLLYIFSWSQSWYEKECLGIHFPYL